jgi:hypothetical protein
VGPEDFRLETLSLPRPPAAFELMLHAVERQGSLSLALQFNTDLFDTATAVRNGFCARTAAAPRTAEPLSSRLLAAVSSIL